MENKRCAACGCVFHPRPQNPEQCYCTAPACQRERRRRWQRAKRHDDPDYRDNQQRAQQAWCRRHPDYWRQYRATKTQNPNPYRLGFFCPERRRIVAFCRHLLTSTDKNTTPWRHGKFASEYSGSRRPARPYQPLQLPITIAVITKHLDELQTYSASLLRKDGVGRG